jgi:hypothetical protein
MAEARRYPYLCRQLTVAILSTMANWYDRSGNPLNNYIKIEELLLDDEYRVIDNTKIGDATISTVWLGLDHSFGADPKPLIFETMIFGGPHDGYCKRYATEIEAQGGHELAVIMILESKAKKYKIRRRKSTK